ncbi:hypothetical protein [Nonomuraea basaltis]|uniref:hypothetical protein n=1 Tax=Nonomuraea basaltis TaxID=2495887 RepID=UPI00110C5D9B|nr:hypothetical protein [Nonomuraea basaltis]TMR94792.1 hypothetical protein EJK15_31765 [Nonomuraea basaltis]
MTDLSVFTEDELNQLLHVPRQVAWAAMLAENDGIIGTAQELYAGGKVLVEAEQYDSEFIRELAARTPEGETIGSDPDEAIADALAKAPVAIAVLRAKGTEDDVHAYGQWLIEIAVKVSDAAKGISSAEQSFVARLTEAIKG